MLLRDRKLSAIPVSDYSYDKESDDHGDRSEDVVLLTLLNGSMCNEDDEGEGDNAYDRKILASQIEVCSSASYVKNLAILPNKIPFQISLILKRS